MTSVEEHDHDEPADPLFDALLEEVCGGQGPPDLRQQILDRWQSGSAPQADGAAGWTELPSIVVPAARHVHPRAGARRGRRILTWWIVGATCLLAMVASWRVVGRSGQRPLRPSVAEGGRTGDPGSTSQDPRIASRSPSRQHNEFPARLPAAGDVAQPAPSPAPATDPIEAQAPVVSADPPARSPESPDQRPDTVRPDSDQLVQLDHADIVEQIDRMLSERWQQLQVDPAGNVSQEVWCRRVFQHLIGREPNGAELREFLQSDDPDPRAALVDHLLGSAHADELAQHWSGRWTAWLLENSPGSTRAFRTGLQNYLAAALAERKGFDQLWSELLTSSGSNDPRRSDYAGGTNYLLALADGADAAHVAGEVCRAMLGQRVACAQCHDDPVRNRSQQDFWQLAATFHQLKTEILRPGRVRLLDREPAVEVALAYTRHDGHPASASPGGLDGQLFDTVAGLSPRSQLAQQLIASPDFARQVVNRCWEAVLQYGFTLPVDDLTPNNLASHPELLTLLSNQFVAHEYDFRELLRWIALSGAVDRSSAITTGNIKDAPTEGGIPLFSRAYHRPALFAQAEQGLAQLNAGQAPPLTYASTEAERWSILGQQLSTPGSGTDGPATRAVRAQGQLLPPHYFTLIRRLSEQQLSADQQIEHAYLVVLGRRPNASEQTQAAQLFAGSADDSTAATERLFWVLLNTTRP